MDRFDAFCESFSAMLGREKTVPARIEKGGALVEELARQPQWLFDFLKKLVLDPALVAAQRPGVWLNEYTIYRSPDKSFVVLAYLWDAGVTDVIHDHGAWGIIGMVQGTLMETKYRRLDDGTREDYCRLEETGEGEVGTGRTTFVLPLDRGIHAMRNPGDEMAASVHVYGKTVGRGYIRFFDPEKHTVTRAYPPRTAKEILAAKSLAAIDPLAAEGVLRQALEAAPPEFLRREYEEVLGKL